MHSLNYPEKLLKYMLKSPRLEVKPFNAPQLYIGKETTYEICPRPKVPRYLGQFPGARSGSNSSESGITAVRACRIAVGIKQRDNDKKTTALSR